MKSKLPHLAAFLTGAVISVMVVCNTELGKATSNEVSLIINQAIGVVLTSLMLAVGRKNPKINPPRRSAPLKMWFGGLFGIGVMVLNFYSVLGVGAGLAMAAAVFGQSLTGLLLDQFGLFGMEKRPMGWRKGLATAVSFLGIAVMSFSNDGQFTLLYILMGMVAGVLTMLQMVYNSSFAKLKGPIFSSRQNALSGVLGTILYAFLLFPSETIDGFKMLPGVSPWLIPAGGLLAIVVVTTTNIVIPKIPAVWSALLLSSGQILASVALDSLLYGKFSAPLLMGGALMLAGICLNAAAENSEAKAA